MSSPAWNPNGTEHPISPYFKYPKYQDTFALIDICLLLFLGIFSVLSNGFLVLITVKFKKALNSSCFYLLGVNAFCDLIVASTGIIASILYAIYGKFKLTRNGCLWFNIAPLTAFHMSFVFVFFIGFDRLLAVFFPIWHLSLAIKSYLSLFCTIALAIGILLSYFAVIFPLNSDQTMIRCYIGDLWNGRYVNILLPVCLTLTVAAVFCYILIFIRLYFRKKAPTTQNNVKKLEGVNKSIMIILLMIIFGWICTSISRQLTQVIFPSPYPAGSIIVNCFDLVLTFVGCANTFVLYNCRFEKIKFGIFLVYIHQV
uniref:G-protein coupled receptors family 1 profile domain-containing protein n=1 Tax=Meloidogyne enterolobii TaxID=390850 RepID=A0A6V7XEK7_MELEN|nr:unnamed protein product [Meloidogyne enterolobii]